METISLTVPHKEGPLRKAAEMLTGLADDCAGVVVEVETPVTVAEVETPVTVVEVETPATVAEVETPGAELEDSGLEGEGLDSEGLPWDVRIHASSKTFLAKTDAWKLKRGVAPAFVEQVKAELRAAQAVVTEVPPVATEPAAEVPVPPVVPIMPPATFESICQKITARANAQLLKTTDIPGVLAPHGLTHIGDLAAHPDLFVAIDAALDTLWATSA